MFEKTIKNKKLIGDKNELYGLLAVLSVFSLITANILSFKQEDLGILILSSGTLLFPISYVVDDILAECYGFWKARKVIYLGFIMNLIFVIYCYVVLALPYPSYFAGQEAMTMVLGFTPIVLVASFTAYIIGSIFNAGTVSFMKKRKAFNNSLFARLFLSTVIGQFLDAFIFTFIAFGWYLPLYDTIYMSVSVYLFKVAVEFVLYPITRKVINYVKKEYNID